MKNNIEITAWARRYQTALRRQARSGKAINPPAALRLGHQAVILGLTTLDVATLHKQAIANVTLSRGVTELLPPEIAQTQAFFAEVTTPIEQTHATALMADARVKRLMQALRQRTQEALNRNQQVKRGVAKRQAAEAALKKSRERRAKLLLEARRLQQSLRQLARGTLAAQENERRKTSQQLYDELAQSLVAINLKLLSLQQATRSNSRTLKKEIDEIAQLVLKLKQNVGSIHGSIHDEGEHNHET